ncbi:MAG: tetratricopeptide repeat protein [Thermodesulfobacteriota bacterium]
MKKLFTTSLAAAFLTLGALGMLSAQKNKADSLLKALKTATHDTSKINTLNRLSDALWRTGEYKKALHYAKQVMKYEVRMTNVKKKWLQKAKATALNNIGLVYWYQGDYPLALQHFQKSLIIKEQLGDKAGIARALNNIGLVYWNQGDYPLALQHYQKSLIQCEALGDKAGIARALGNIGLVYADQGDYPLALQHYQKSLIQYEALGDKAGISRTLNNIGNVYADQGETPLALQHYQKSLIIKEALGDKAGIAAALNNIGELLKDEALIAGEAKQSPLRETLLGQALEQYKKSMEISVEIGSKPYLMANYEGISEVYAQMARRSPPQPPRGGALPPLKAALKALEYYMLFKQISDTLFNEEKSKEIGRIEAWGEYEMQKLIAAQKQKKQQKAKDDRDRMQFIGMFIALIGVFAGVFFVANILMPDWLVNLISWVPFVMLFEFILVFTDPWVEQLTGGQPFYKFLFNTSIAIMLFFVQQYFQQKLRERMYRIRKMKAKKRKKMPQRHKDTKFH